MTELKYSIFNGMHLECAESLGNAMLSNMVGGWLGMCLHVIWNIETHSKSDSIPFHDYFMAFQSTINRPSKFSTNQPRAIHLHRGIRLCFHGDVDVLPNIDGWRQLGRLCRSNDSEESTLDYHLWRFRGGWSLKFVESLSQVIIIEVLKGHVSLSPRIISSKLVINKLKLPVLGP